MPKITSNPVNLVALNNEVG